MVIDDKGGEIVYKGSCKDSEKITKGEKLTSGERYDKVRDQLKF